MIYSIYNWNTGQYDFFDSKEGERPGQRPLPRTKVNQPNGKGYQPESLMPILPRDAIPVGSGDVAKGRIAVHWSSAAASLGAYKDPGESPLVHSPWLTLGLTVGGVLLSFRLLIAIARRF